MGTPYVGEIRMFGGNFAPAGWLFCDGSLLPISENDTLFALIGTTYGGDGQQTFALPDLRSRIPIHAGTGPGLSTRTLGETGGIETVTLTVSQIPVHTHAGLAQSGNGSQSSPGNGLWAGSSQGLYAPGPGSLAMNPAAIGSSGGSQPHDNAMPFTAVSFIISLFGIFPSQS
jgi:microcystin-dependent protein